MAEWFREYSPGIVMRFFAIFLLWGFYNLVPYTLPRTSLFIVTALMVAYAIQLFGQKARFMAYLILFAAICNTIIALTPASRQTPPVLLFVLVFLILFLDIVSTPMRSTQ